MKCECEDAEIIEIIKEYYDKNIFQLKKHYKQITKWIRQQWLQNNNSLWWKPIMPILLVLYYFIGIHSYTIIYVFPTGQRV